MFQAIRSFGRHHPKLRTASRPAWQRLIQLLWTLRRKVLGQRPITFAAGKHTISMVPQGQIAEYIWQGVFEESERNFAVNEIKSGMRVLNIGANSGLYTIIASKMVGPDGIVHSFEPSSRNFALLKKNIELNDCGNVIANNIALADFCGQLSLNCDLLHPEFDGHFYVRPLTEITTNSSTSIEIVSCTTLDEYWRDACGGEIKAVDFIIIDVEGAELSVFQGARQTIEASPSLAIIMECSSDIPQIGDLFNKFGFAFFGLDLNSPTLHPVKLGQGSLIALRNARLEPSPSFRQSPTTF